MSTARRLPAETSAKPSPGHTRQASAMPPPGQGPGGGIAEASARHPADASVKGSGGGFRREPPQSLADASVGTMSQLVCRVYSMSACCNI